MIKRSGWKSWGAGLIGLAGVIVAVARGMAGPAVTPAKPSDTQILKILQNRIALMPANSCHPRGSPVQGFDETDAEYKDKNKPPVEATVAWGCCGQPGQRVCDRSCANLPFRFDNTFREDPYNKSVVCNLPPPCNSPGVTSPCTQCGPGIAEALRNDNRSDTFFATSDIHFFRGSFAVEDQIRHVDEMNAFGAGTFAWDGFFGLNTGRANDKVAMPWGVVVNGDFTTFGAIHELGAFRLLYESNWVSGHSGSLRYPLFVGLGNHEEFTGFKDATTDVQDRKHRAQRIFDYMTSYMTCPGIKVDWDQDKRRGSGLYSWNKGGVHYVQMHTMPEETDSYYQPDGYDKGINWLKSDMANIPVGMPVVLFEHYPLATLSKFRMSNLWEAVKDNNVIGIFVGHTHVNNVKLSEDMTFTADDGETRRYGERTVTWTNRFGEPKGIDQFTSGTGGQGECGLFGTPGTGSFIVARVTQNYLDVGHVFWDAGLDKGVKKGTLPAQNPFTGSEDENSARLANLHGKCATGASDRSDFSVNYYGGPDAVACRKRINDRFFDVSDGINFVPGSGAQRIAALQQAPGKQRREFPGPLALQVKELSDAVGLINRSFVDRCAVPTTASSIKPSAYVLLSDEQVQRINAGNKVEIPLSFTSDPGTIELRLVNLTPIHRATPSTVEITLPVTNTKGGRSMGQPSPVEVRMTHGTRVKGGFEVSISYDSGKEEGWLKATKSERDSQFGYFIVQLEVDKAKLPKDLPMSMALRANLKVTPFATAGKGILAVGAEVYEIPISLRLTEQTSITVVTTRPGGIGPPMLTANITYSQLAQPNSSDSSNRPRPSGALKLYERPKMADPRSQPQPWTLRSTVTLNTNSDVCNASWDSVNFNCTTAQTLSGTRCCPDGIKLAQLSSGMHEFKVEYGGDHAYAAGSSPVVSYELTSCADPPTLATLTHWPVKILNDWQSPSASSSDPDQYRGYSISAKSAPPADIFLLNPDSGRAATVWQLALAPDDLQKRLQRNLFVARQACDSIDPCPHLSWQFDGLKAVLLPRGKTDDVVPWEFVPTQTPGKFNIYNWWHDNQDNGKDHAGKHLSWDRTNGVRLKDKDNTWDLVPWRLMFVCPS